MDVESKDGTLGDFRYVTCYLLLSGLFRKLRGDCDIGLAKHLLDNDQFTGIVAFNSVTEELQSIATNEQQGCIDPCHARGRIEQNGHKG